jgi:hypothetical protein
MLKSAMSKALIGPRYWMGYASELQKISTG